MPVQESLDQFTNTRKADFKSIYNQPDPRAYFEALTPLQYQIPQQALPFVERVLELSAPSLQDSINGTLNGTANGCLNGNTNKPRKVLDVCCSYGINAALLRYDLGLEGLAEHYAASSPKVSPEEQIESDKLFFASRLRNPEIQVLGLDVAPAAISYSVATGLMAAGWAENLETSDPSPSLRAALKDVDVVVCTGGVGYVGARTFARIAASVQEPEKLWMVTFVLRVFEFGEVAGVLEAEYGLVTDKVPGRLFRQRRFTSSEEQSAAVADVRARGFDTAGFEEDGWFYAECYLTRPKGAVGVVEGVLGGRSRI